ncbi:MAG: acyl-CoA dehydrogenase family protein [Halioglobus sp.]|jgi:alkylation response protein AidB-like acyl-CoA dehydrogenase|uniref:Acyl-CoA dehydrogenase n=1 Tax=Candidatus Seongchinamella marina TaxID=2518990 RepID=A0ABT3SQA1_9GAMM|nr:acyl-CoA dehydrogenase family protein [Candidatus Seongchinamella marina]MBT3409954.1 acyl-CoA dehydrogenase [Halieaceae bacterium]MDG1388983.1 acyl-CoA dehydrogenase family protein [Halioglobus sp.]MBT6125109.1 acyl-CoA dehydrogenase [Halieaceae bacterium]MBT7721165.1 acyl-CoA dehydrogenase [Halieaceae bacterium]MCX2972146.1 acyl-CoA dehydrogenase [Candidatus Seongchinamella marina]
MKLSFSAQDEQFRTEVAGWLNANLTGEFEKLKFRGGPGDEHMYPEERKAWEKKLAEGGWTCVGWPAEHGGRACSIEQQVIFFEEYARAGAPGRVGHIGEGLTGPTLIAFGSEAQKEKYLPGIVSGEELWCQGYSEPGAGSDLANVKTKARFDEDRGQWILNGQKVWTSLAHEADYCFVIARTDPDSVAHKGLGFFLIKMDQPGVEIRPIEQITGTSEFNEVFFDEAECDAQDIVGAPGDGWKVAMGLLGFERGVSTLGQQMQFQNELDEVVALAKTNGAARDPIIRQRIARAHAELKIMRYNSMRMLSGQSGSDGSLQKEALIYKLFWATWHRGLGELAMDVMGPECEILDDGPYELNRLQSMYLFVRSDTIYGGTNQIQRNIIAERGLGMPKEPRVTAK